MKRGLQRHHSLLKGNLPYHWMRKPGSQRVLFLRSTMEVTADEWRSVLCVWKIYSSVSLPQNASKYLHHCLPECLSAHIHLSIQICHSCPFSLSLSNSAYCVSFYELYLFFLLSFTAVYLTLLLPSSPPPPSLHSPRSKHVSPPQ